jgi:protein SCO1/2
MKYRNVLVMIFVVVITAGASRIAEAQNRPTGILSEVGIDQRLNAQVDLDLMFNDETGRSVRLGQYFGKRPVVLSLVYYECPMLCTLVLNGLVKSLRAMTFSAGREFEVVTISFDPKETPALAASKKQQYIKGYGRPDVGEGWHFLTGDNDAIDRLTAQVGFRHKYDESTGQWAHASGIIVVTPDGRVSKYFYGLEYSARDLRLSLVEASQGQIGTTVDQVLLYCFHYDPTTGKYGLVIMNVIRLAGLMTVVALGAFMFVMLRRERHEWVGRR